MKVGSLVVCIIECGGGPYAVLITPSSKVYTVYEIAEEPTWGLGVQLEEYPENSEGIFYMAKCFREVLPPMDIMAEIEQQSELVNT